MTVKELKEQVNSIKDSYDNLEVVLPAGVYKEGYTPAGGIHASGTYVYDNFAKTDEDRKRKHVCVVSLT